MKLLSNKKHISQIFLCITALSALQSTFAAPTVSAAPKQSRFQRFAKKLNLSSQDLTTFLFVSPVLFSASFLTKNPTLKTFLRIAAIVPTIVAAALPKKAVDAIAKIPGVDKGSQPRYCDNKECKWLCCKCKGRVLYFVISSAGAPFLIRLLSSETKRIVQEHIARQCERCAYDAHNLRTPCCNRNMCQQCAHIDMASEYAQCPLCHANTPAHQERLARQCAQCHYREGNQQTPCCNQNLCEWCAGFYMNSEYGQCPLCHANSPAHQNRLNRAAREHQERLNREARQCAQCRIREHNQQTPCCNRNICQVCSNIYLNSTYGRCPLCQTNTRARQEQLNREARERAERQRREAQEREEQRRERAARQQREAEQARRERAERQQREQREQQQPQQNTHYQILGIAQNASAAEIRRAYLQLALRFHPDKAATNNITNEEALRRMQQINEANDILSNPDTRREYDYNILLKGGRK